MVWCGKEDPQVTDSPPSRELSAQDETQVHFLRVLTTQEIWATGQGVNNSLHIQRCPQSLPPGYLFLNCCSSTVVFILALPCPARTPIPDSHLRTFSLGLCQCVLYTCSLLALPLYSPIIHLQPTLWLLSVYSLFHVSGYILLTCLFC